MTIRLSPTQRAILEGAAARPDGALTPVPAAVTVRGKSLERTLAALVRRGFATDTATLTDDAVGQSLGDAAVTGLVITLTGRAAAGGTDGAADVIEAQTPSPDLTAPGSHCSVIPAPGGKLGMVLQVVAKDDGATIEEIAGATVSSTIPVGTHFAGCRPASVSTAMPSKGTVKRQNLEAL